jgi:hypothetical protein
MGMLIRIASHAALQDAHIALVAKDPMKSGLLKHR